jgi:hypothetical protein
MADDRFIFIVNERHDEPTEDMPENVRTWVEQDGWSGFHFVIEDSVTSQRIETWLPGQPEYVAGVEAVALEAAKNVAEKKEAPQ